MFMANLNMNPTDFAVSRAIGELHERYETINYEMIANYIGCAEVTVKRSMSRMKQDKLVKVIDGASKSGGFRYEYVGKR